MPDLTSHINDKYMTEGRLILLKQSGDSEASILTHCSQNSFNEDEDMKYFEKSPSGRREEKVSYFYE
jgi:hypothetical protein